MHFKLSRQNHLNSILLYICKLIVYNVPLFVLFTFLRSNPIIQQWVSTSFPIYHLSKAIMFGAQVMLSIIGYQTALEFTHTIYHYGVFSIQIIEGSPIFLGFSCLGLIISWFFSTIIIASRGGAIIKFFYIFAGIILIQILNIFRMSYLSWLLRDGTIAFPQITILDSITFDHHDIFNFFIYLIVLFLIIFWFENKKLRELKNIKGSFQ